jgi:putative DNA methylase
MTQQLIRALDRGGDAAAGRLALELEQGGTAGVEVARDLAYRLHAIAERNGWAEEALGYNALVAAWPEITGRLRAPARTAREIPEPRSGSPRDPEPRDRA